MPRLQFSLAHFFTLTVLIPLGLWLGYGMASLPAWLEQLTVPLRVLGITSGAIGLWMVTEVLWLFMRPRPSTPNAVQTPRPIMSIRGIYRRLRNPYKLGVVLILVGEGLFMLSDYMLSWAVVIFAFSLWVVTALDEPRLTRLYGADYHHYCQHVPRWLPRRTLWKPPQHMQ